MRRALSALAALIGVTMPLSAQPGQGPSYSEEPFGQTADGTKITAYTLLVERPTNRIERSCSSKIPYASRREARARVRDGRNQDGTLRPYHCQFCDLWHLGHSRRRH